MFPSETLMTCAEALYWSRRESGDLPTPFCAPAGGCPSVNYQLTTASTEWRPPSIPFLVRAKIHDRMVPVKRLLLTTALLLAALTAYASSPATALADPPSKAEPAADESA